MSKINVTNLTFAYEGSYDTIFKKVSFAMDTSWRLGLIGRNGRGKTTLLKLLMGEYAYSGVISGAENSVYFPFVVENRETNGRELFNRLAPDAQLWELERELSLLALESQVLHCPFSKLSHGEQTKLLLAILFLRENRFLLIDEPTNHLDLEGRALVSAYLKRKSGFILVSHDRVFLDSCIDHVLSINKTDIQVQKGNFSSWWENKRREDSFEMETSQRLKKDIKRLEEAAKQRVAWSNDLEKTKKGSKNSGLRPDRGFIGHKSAKLMKRAKSIEQRQDKAIEEKSGLLKNIETTETLRLSPLQHHATRLIQGEGLSLFYGEKRVCGPLSFTIERGQRVAVLGKNGSGKSSLLKAILGEDIGKRGQLLAVGDLKISYVSQDTAHLKGDLKDFAREQGIEESLLKAILRKLDFSRIQFEKQMDSFSGGQKKKVLLAASLCQRAHIYIWDEPLNYVDVLSRMQIEALLQQEDITLLFVEHDQAFCDKIATDYLYVSP